MLPNYEVKYIQNIVEDLHKQLNIKNYPIKMFDVFKLHYKDNVVIGAMNIDPEKADVDISSNYIEELDKYIMIINKDRIQPNLMKRLNFSLAHELGHIVLKHWSKFKIIGKLDRLYEESYYNFMNSITEEEQAEIENYYDNPYILEQEADEFAGQFLAPLKIIEKYSINAEKKLSDFFFVSSKVIRIRFETLERLKPAKLPPVKKTQKQLMDEFFEIANKRYF
jgi:Zn-dependent peptidase ImmA (M78 family)